MDVCTIVSRRELARARVLASTLRDHVPDASLTVLLLDTDRRSVSGFKNVNLLNLEEAAGDAGGLLAAANPPGALAIALIPHLVSTLLDRGAGSVVYLGSGQRVLGPLDALRTLLSDHQIVLVARLAADRPSALALSEDRTHSVFSQELLGLTAGPAARELLRIWPRYFAEHGDAGRSAVRAWLDGLPALAEDAVVLRDPTYGTDPWTLDHLPVDAGRDTLAIDGRPVRTFDFSEMSPRAPMSLCDGQGRVKLSSVPALADLCRRQADELLAAGYERDTVQDASFVELDGGVRLTPTIRRLLVKGIEEGALTRSPFTDAGRRELLAYLDAPTDRGEQFGLTRLHMAIWDAREDVRAAYPHIDGPDGPGFAGWLWRYGQEQEGISTSLLPPVPEPAFRDANPRVHDDPPRWGVNVAGFFTAELGMGEAARLLIAALDSHGVPSLPIQGHLMPPSRQGVDFSYARPDEAAYPINMLCINGDGIPVFAREAGRSFFEGRYTIAAWWWEIGEPPAAWMRAFDYVDEVWVTSQHIYDLIAPGSPVPVVKMTMPLLMPSVATASREDLGLPEEGFLFLFVHDYHSVAARKNPIGVIEAFRRAFPAGSGAKLVIKSINAAKLPHEHDRVVVAAADHADITLIDGYVSAAEKNAMIAHCDCYVSLHRSEGFGLTVAEAMLLGKPVISTRFGGTLDFTNDQNSYLVNYRPAAVGTRAGIYAPDAVWAEPDLDHAASLMREVFADRAVARERGELARRQISEAHSPAVAGEGMTKRLRLIHRRLTDKGMHTVNLRHLPPSEAGANYPEGLGRPPRIDWGGGWLGRLRLRAQRPVADWIRTYLEHQSSIDAQAFDRIASLDSRVRELVRTLSEQQQAQHAETLAELRRLQAQLSERHASRQGPDAGLDGKTVPPGAAQTTDADG